MIRASDSRVFSVGLSVRPDARGAGEEAATLALAPGGGATGGAGAIDAKLVLAFCSDRLDTRAVLDGIRSVTGQVPLIGGTTAGELTHTWTGDSSVVVTVLGGPGLAVATGVARGLTGRQRQAGAEVAACVSALDPALYRVMVTLLDGLSPDPQEVIRGVYSVLGAEVPLVGGGTGDNLRMESTTQLYDDEILTDAVVSAALGSPVPFGIGIQHGWRQVGPSMIVTRSDGHRIHSINDEPALDLYLRLLNAPDRTEYDQAAFGALTMIHPLGLMRPSGEVEMRFISGADPLDRSLTCLAEVLPGTLLYVSECDRDSILDAADGACRAAVVGLDGRPPIGFLTFDCISRRGALGVDGVREEMRRMAGQTMGAPMSGFYTYGEIARTRGINGYHNQTLVVLAMS